MIEYKIYRLIRNEEIIYIGRTKFSLHKRFLTGWKYIDKTDISIELIESTNDISRERYWISWYKNIGIQLLNKRGGDGLDHKEYYRNLKKEWRKNNRDRVNKQKREYYKKNKLLKKS